jgi:hypothetical protein
MAELERRQLIHGAAATAALAAVARPVLAQVEDAGRAAMARAAAAFLTTLDPRQRQTATFKLGDDERRNWHYVPRGRKGLPFKEMPPAARTAAHELMQASLSAVGYAKAVDVIRLEEVLRQAETFGGLLRDPEKYYVTVFGDPGAAAPWGWRLEGHHLSLNFTLVPGRAVAVTPAFLGANPAEVGSGPHRGLRALAEEQDLAFALVGRIDGSLRSRLVIATSSPGDIVSGPGRGDSLKAPAGVPLDELGAEPRALALRLLETYARNMRSDVAEAELRRARDAGWSACTLRGRGRSIAASPTTTGSTGRRCSSSTTTPRTMPTTCTRCGTTLAVTSAATHSARTTSIIAMAPGDR